MKSSKRKFTPEQIRKAMLLYAVSDSSWLLDGETLADKFEACLKGGATFMQLREKDATTQERVALAKELMPICEKAGVPFVIDDDVQAALESGCDGVHVGQGDTTCADARAILGPDKIVGVSCHTVPTALLAQEQGADYLGVGTLFPTSTKPSADVITFETMKAITDAVDIPVVAIGGITKDNVSQLAGLNLAGIAVVSALFAQPDCEKAAKELVCLTKEMLAH